MRKTYRLRNWRGWDRHIDSCARDFLAEFGVAPNLLVANAVTLRRFNLAADKGHVGNKGNSDHNLYRASAVLALPKKKKKN